MRAIPFITVAVHITLSKVSAVELNMDKKRTIETGIRIKIPQGTNEAVAVDQLVTDFLRGDFNAVLHDLHEPHDESHEGHYPTLKKRS